MTIADLWLPILVAAVAVFMASSVIHMVLAIHKNDFQQLPNEAQVMDALRNVGVPPGNWAMPHCGSMQELGTPEFQEKMRRGPVVMMTVRPSGPPTMGKALLQWFLYCVLIGVFAAYLGRLALPPGAEFLKVFQVTGAVAFLGYAFSSVMDSIWKAIPWSVTLKFLFDGLVYALLTALIFGWFWPAAV